MLTATVNKTDVKIYSDFPDGYEETGNFFNFYRIIVDLTCYEDIKDVNAIAEELEVALEGRNEMIEYSFQNGKLTCMCSSPEMVVIRYPHMLGQAVEEMVNGLTASLTSIQSPYELELGMTCFNFNF